MRMWAGIHAHDIRAHCVTKFLLAGRRHLCRHGARGLFHSFSAFVLNVPHSKPTSDIGVGVAAPLSAVGTVAGFTQELWRFYSIPGAARHATFLTFAAITVTSPRGMD